MPDPEIPASVITIARGLSLFVASLPAKSMLRRLVVVLDVVCFKTINNYLLNIINL